MKKLILLMFFSTPVFAFVPISQNCADNYYFGVDSAYNSSTHLPSQYAASCFVSGFNAGKELSIEFANNRAACDDAYKSGFFYGIRADILMITGPSNCSSAGYFYGLAWLRDAARSGNAAVASPKCINAYRVGYTEGLKNTVSTTYGTEMERTCYSYGFGDASAGM